MVTYTDSRGSSVSSVDKNAPVAPGDVMIYDPQGNAFITASSNAAAMTQWLAARAAGDTTSTCPATQQSHLTPQPAGTPLLPGNVWVRDRWGNQYQTTPDQAEGLQKVVDRQSANTPRPGYEYITIGGERIEARSDMMAALGQPGTDKFAEARNYYAGLLSVHGYSQRTGEDTSGTGNKQDPVTKLWSKNPTNAPKEAGPQPNDYQFMTIPKPYVSGQGSLGDITVAVQGDTIVGQVSSANRSATRAALEQYNPLDPENSVLKFFYVPEGSYMQQQLKNVKVAVSESGEIGIYEMLGKNAAGEQRMAINPDTGVLEPFILIGGASRNAAQSGEFGFAAATPAVYGRGQVQYGMAGLINPAVMAPGLETTGLTGEEVFRIVEGGNKGGYDIRDYLSRLGSEAYGGMVQFIDKRTLGDIRYEDRSNRAAWNLASYVDPLAVNRGKADLPGAHILWSVGENAPGLFFMDQNTKAGEDLPAIPVKSFGAYFPRFGSAYEGGNVAGTFNPPSTPLVITNAIGMGSGNNEGLTGTTTVATELIRTANVPEPQKENNTSIPGQDAFRMALSFGGVFPVGGFVVDTVAAVVKGKPSELPFYDFGMSVYGAVTPWKQPKGTVTKDEYEAGVSAYEARVNAYEARRKAYEDNGSQSQTEYAALNKEYNALQGRFDTLEKQRGNIVDQPTALDRIGAAYEALNAGMAPYTTDVPGIGAALKKMPDSTLGADIGMPIYGDVINLTKGTYVGYSQYPVDLAVTFGAGALFETSLGAVRWGVAKAAMSSTPSISTAGRLLSTPAAIDLGTLAKTGLGVFAVYESGQNVINQPTATKKGEALGRTAIQFAGFGVGMGSAPTIEARNDFYGKTMAGEMAMGPIERVSYGLKTKLFELSQPTTEQATIARSVAILGGNRARFQEAPVKGEPVFEEALALGEKYGPVIRKVAESKTNPAITKGSMVVTSQYPEKTVAETGLREAKDWDAFVSDVGAKYEEIVAVSKAMGKSPSEVIYPYKKVPQGMVSDWSGKPIPTNVGMGKVFHHTEYPSKGVWLTKDEHWLWHDIDQGVVAKTAANTAFYNRYRITTPQTAGVGRFNTAEEVIASNIADIRPIPKDYPGFAQSTAPDVRPDEGSPVTLYDRVFGNPFERIIGPRGTSEQLLAGRTIGYSGKTNAEAAQAQFGRKVGSALADFVRDPIGQGYRVQKDLYDSITIYWAQKITARNKGIDVTKGDWAKGDKAIEDLLNVEITIGGAKGQSAGGRKVLLRDLFEEKLREVRGGKKPTPDVEGYLPESGTPAAVPSVVSATRSIGISASGAGIPSLWKSRAGSGSQSPSSPSYFKHASPSNPSVPSKSASTPSSPSPSTIPTSPWSVTTTPSPSPSKPARASQSPPSSPPSGFPSPRSPFSPSGPRSPSPSKSPSPTRSPSPPSPSPSKPSVPWYPTFSPPSSPTITRVPPISFQPGGGGGTPMSRKWGFRFYELLGFEVGKRETPIEKALGLKKPVKNIWYPIRKVAWRRK